MIQIEVFSAPGCGKCGKAKEMLKQILEDWSATAVSWREVNVLDELDYAVELGVLSTPAIAVNGELVFTSLPSEKKMRRILSACLREPQE